MRFFFNDPAAPEIHPLSLQTLFRSNAGVGDVVADQPRPAAGVARGAALALAGQHLAGLTAVGAGVAVHLARGAVEARRSEEHTSELQSQSTLVCRLLLEQNTDVHIR